MYIELCYVTVREGIWSHIDLSKLGFDAKNELQPGGRPKTAQTGTPSGPQHRADRNTECNRVHHRDNVLFATWQHKPMQRSMALAETYVAFVAQYLYVGF